MPALALAAPDPPTSSGRSRGTGSLLLARPWLPRPRAGHCSGKRRDSDRIGLGPQPLRLGKAPGL